VLFDVAEIVRLLEDPESKKAAYKVDHSELMRCLKRGVEVRMRINGWQRLWLLASILWAVVILALSGILQSDGPTASEALFVVRLWIVPITAVYGCGIGLAWVRRGFKVESQ
jgi:hypothetical protein